MWLTDMMHDDAATMRSLSFARTHRCSLMTPRLALPATRNTALRGCEHFSVSSTPEAPSSALD